MPDRMIEAALRDLMGPAASGSPRTPQGRWAWDMYEWCRKVRRDIIVLEAHVAAAKGVDPSTLFYLGEPGDPPPPPPEW